MCIRDRSPEGRRVFANLTVLENLKAGAYLRKDKDGIEKDIKCCLLYTSSQTRRMPSFTPNR